jgi:hypothetical protein
MIPKIEFMSMIIGITKAEWDDRHSQVRKNKTSCSSKRAHKLRRVGVHSITMEPRKTGANAKLIGVALGRVLHTNILSDKADSQPPQSILTLEGGSTNVPCYIKKEMRYGLILKQVGMTTYRDEL